MKQLIRIRVDQRDVFIAEWIITHAEKLFWFTPFELLLAAEVAWQRHHHWQSLRDDPLNNWMSMTRLELFMRRALDAIRTSEVIA